MPLARLCGSFLPCLLLIACSGEESALSAPSRAEAVQIETPGGRDIPFARVPGPDDSNAILDTGSPGSWNEQVVGMPTVVFANGQYMMWYHGSRAVQPGESVYLENGGIGLAVSDDGYVWRHANGGQPVFSAGEPGSFDDHAVFHPHVILHNGLFYLWYGAADGSQAPSAVRIERTGLATSADGIHWTRANGGQPVLDIGVDGSADSIQATGVFVLHDGGIFRMWYGAYDGVHTMMYAESVDGVHWNKSNGGRPVDGLDPTGTGVLGPSVYSDGRRLVMLYSRLVDQQWMLYGATSQDGRTWTSAWNGQPVVGLASEPDAFDAAGPGRNSAVHPSQVLFVGGRARAWYMGEEAIAPYRQRIGLLEGELRPN